MTTDIRMPWDAFVDMEVARSVPHEDARPARDRSVRAMITRFRANEWPRIKTELATRNWPDAFDKNNSSHPWVVPDDLEPHWTGPGKAVYWQQEQKLPSLVWNESLKRTERIPGGDGEWKPTLPLPANPASQIAHYLGKGFRLRPPRDAAEEASLKKIQPVEPAPEPVPEPPRFECNRHGLDRRAFSTWKGYLAHCLVYKELPDAALVPLEVHERSQAFPYYCTIHDKGFTNKKLAERHIKIEKRRQVFALHLNLEDLRMESYRASVHGVVGVSSGTGGN
jgi:hypothetical protein